MRIKKEKTEFGTVKSVGLKAKKVNYGVVEDLSTPEKKEMSPVEVSDSSAKDDFEVKGESSDKASIEEIMHNLIKQFAKEDEERKKDEGKESEKEEKSKSDDEKSKPEEKPQENEFLTEYLRINVSLRALASLLGSCPVAQSGVVYYSFSYSEGEGFSTNRLLATDKRILDFDTFPWFDSEEKAKAFLELCRVVINRYCHLMSVMNPTAILTAKPFKVIHI